MSQAHRGSSPGNLDEWPDWLHCVAFVLLVPFILWRLGKDKPALYKNGDKYVPITRSKGKSQMNFTPNPEQTKSVIRWLITVFGASFAGWLAHSGYISTQQVMDILNSQVFMSAAVAVAGAVWGLLAHTQSNAVAVVAKIAADPNSAVVGVVTTDNAEGRALATSLPAEVAAANSPGARMIALDSVPPMPPKAPEPTPAGPAYHGGPKGP